MPLADLPALGRKRAWQSHYVLSLRGHTSGRGNLFCYYIHMKRYFVYILTNKINTVLYVGITNDLIRRIYEHKNELVKGFTKKYNVNKLVYFEEFSDPENAILREKQIKAGSRKKKLDLIMKNNPKFKDLYTDIL